MHSSGKSRASILFLLLIILVVAGAVAALSWYGYQRMNSLSQRIALLESAVATTTSQLQQGIEASQNAILEAQQQSSALATQMGTVQQQFGDISSNVSTLEKLSKLDPQILAKYS